MGINSNKVKFKDLPFSKKTVTYARLEAYVFSAVLVFMVWCGKDVSAISIVLSLAWAGYRAIQGLYINMAKHEHLMDKKIEYKKLGLETDALDTEIEVLETEDIDFSDFN